jgi:hypothetical protein
MPLPTTTWFEPNWQDDELMTEIKLDAQQGSSDFLRDRARNRILFGTAEISSEEYNTGGSPTGSSQVRLVVRPTGSAIVLKTNAVAFQPTTVASSLIDSAWAVAEAKNVSWSETPSTMKDFDVLWQWRAAHDEDPDAGWATLGATDVLDVGFWDEANDYVSLWAEVIAIPNYREFGSLAASGWVWVLMRHLTVVGGRINEEFS